MWLDLRYTLSQGRDRTFTWRAARFLDVLEATQTDPWQSRQAKLKQLAEAIPEGDFMQVLDPSGERLFPESAWPAGFPWPPLANPTRDPYRDITYRGRPFRIFTHPVQAERPYVIRVAGQLEDNRNMMGRFTTGHVAAIPVMLILSALGGYFLSRRILEPVDQITGALRSISIGNLSQRLPVSCTGDELQRLADTCNGMLERLEGAVERISRFTADASHELRSPVALIRTVAEYALRNPNMDQESKEAFEEILAEAVDTGKLIEDLLILARADAGYANAVFEPLELSELILEVSAKVRLQAEARNQTLTVRTASDQTWITGDRPSLRRLVSILLDNAIKYTPANGHIEVQLELEPPEAVLMVTDSGIGISEALLPRIFDRFVRADPSRGEVNGTGLGLAIAKWISGAHHAELTVQSREREGSVFKVVFPLTSPSRLSTTQALFANHQDRE